MSKSNNLSDVVAYLIMAVVYFSVAIYFVSLRTSVVQVVLTLASFIIGAIFYFKLTFKHIKEEEMEKNLK